MNKNGLSYGDLERRIAELEIENGNVQRCYEQTRELLEVAEAKLAKIMEWCENEHDDSGRLEDVRDIINGEGE